MPLGRARRRTGYQYPSGVIAGEDPTRTSSSGGNWPRASMAAVKRAWPSSTTRPPPFPGPPCGLRSHPGFSGAGRHSGSVWPAAGTGPAGWAPLVTPDPASRAMPHVAAAHATSSTAIWPGRPLSRS